MTQQAMDIVRAFTQSEYVLRRKVFTFLGKKFHVYDAAGNVVLFSHMKAFKLKDDIRLYSGEDMKTEILSIKARSILDFSSAFDVVDSENGERIGTLKRKGWKSMVQDEWIIMDAAGRDIGLVTEDSMSLALIRRFVEIAAMLLPQAYHVTIAGHRVAEFRQNFNPFVQKLSVKFAQGTEKTLDRRLGLAAAILIIAVEGRQQNEGGALLDI